MLFLFKKKQNTTMVLLIILNTSLSELYKIQIKRKQKQKNMKIFLNFSFIEMTVPTITASQTLSIPSKKARS